MLRRIFIFFLALVCGFFFITSRNLFCRPDKSGGLKYFKNYSPDEYNQQPQNWMILEDKRGIIYIANQGGLMEYDGVSWRLIAVPNQSVRSTAIDDTGAVYIGGKNEIGFLAPGSKGSLKYVSLLDFIGDNNKNFGNVWSTHTTKEGIYFRTSKFLFRWHANSGQLKVWKAGVDDRFRSSFYCRGKLLVQQENKGVMQMVKDSLELLPGTETFPTEKIHMIVPFTDAPEKWLMGTRVKGLFVYDGKTTEPFPTTADNYLKEKQLYHGIRTRSSSSAAAPAEAGDFALATLRGGLVVIDSQGNLKQIFDKAWGLQDDNVKYVFRDSGGNLWLALSKGITRIEYASPITIYNDRSKLPGLVLSVVKHQNILYAGTNRGLFFFASAGTFYPAAGMANKCFSILSTGDSLLAATTDGVFQVDTENNNRTIRKVIENSSYMLHRSGQDKNRVWVGTVRGPVSLYLKNQKGRWAEEYRYRDITQPVRTIVEDKKGNLWMGTETRGVLKADFLNVLQNPVVTRYHTGHGLPPGEVHVFTAAGHVMFAADQGIFRFDEKTRAFVPDFALGTEFADGSRGVFRIAEDKNRHIWFHSNNRNIQAIARPDGTFVLNKKPFLRIPLTGVNSIYPDPGGETVWFAANDGLIRYDTTVKKNYSRDFHAIIRKVQLVNDKSLVFDGYNPTGVVVPFPVFGYKDRNLRFRFACPFFEDESSTTYRVFLEGYDEAWSAWSRETQKDYTNLDSGFYTFRVRGRNIYGHESKEAFFQFKVLPPWYKSWWAFLLYVLGVLFLVYAAVRWRSWKLEQEKQHLEQIVKERTTEIEGKNRQLEEQSEQLKEMDKVKSRFFANISHEFRTPLTLIMGPLEQILADPPNKEELEKKANLMLRNSQRLLGLINQLLELSKFESGKMKLRASRRNMVVFLKGILASFELMAETHELDLTFERETEDIPLYFDAEKLEKAVGNLLSNGVKFTPAGGKITVSVKQVPGQREFFPAGYVEIAVKDTGIGIAENRLAKIFDRFYQAEATDIHEHRHKGSGIGLALAKELVELHHGTISVSSREAEAGVENGGSEFIIRLPMGKGHLESGEIVDLDETPAGHPEPEQMPADYETETGEETCEAGKDNPVKGESESEAAAAEKNVILVVDDSADIRGYMRGALEPFYRVEEARDGREAIGKAREIIPDLIVCDIMMPEVDGYEVCRILKEDRGTSHIPFILLTAKASDENVIRGLETGADDYITKPFNTRILTARIKNLIDLRRQLQLKRRRQMTLQPDEISVTSIDETFYKELQDVIEKNLDDPEFSVEQLCKKLYIGRTSLYRKILALTGDPPTGFIRSYRLSRAAQLLKARYGNVTEVAFAVGFSSTAYFTKCFKEKFHQIPSTFQEAE